MFLGTLTKHYNFRHFPILLDVSLQYQFFDIMEFRANIEKNTILFYIWIQKKKITVLNEKLI